MHRFHRAVIGALTLGPAACAGPATVEPPPLHGAPPAAAVADRAEPELDRHLARSLEALIHHPGGRIRFAVLLDLGDDPEADAIGPVSSVVHGEFDPVAGRWAAGLEGDPLALPDPGEPGLDPAPFAEVLRGAGPLEPDGHEVIDGRAAHRYRSVVHLDRVLERVADERRALVGVEVEQLAALLEELGASPGDDAVAVELWLADDDRLLRLQLEPVVAPGTFGPGATARVTLDLYDDGSQPVAVAPGGTAAP
jgi:hypothetical protein